MKSTETGNHVRRQRAPLVAQAFPPSRRLQTAALRRDPAEAGWFAIRRVGSPNRRRVKLRRSADASANAEGLRYGVKTHA